MVEMSLCKGHTNGNFLVGLPPPIKKATHKGKSAKKEPPPGGGGGGSFLGIFSFVGNGKPTGKAHYRTCSTWERIVANMGL